MNEGRASRATQTAENVHATSARPSPSSDLVEAFQQYARERPQVLVLWCLGIGFVLGWKLKMW